METEPSNEPEATIAAEAAELVAVEVAVDEPRAPDAESEPESEPALDAAALDEDDQDADAPDDGEADGGTDGDADTERMRLEPIIESMLLASGAPVPLARLVEALDGPERREVVAALASLSAGYERDGRGLRIILVGGGYQLRSAPEHGPWVRRLLGGRPPRLSRPLLETLAIVAYRQPCTRPEIEAIRGVDADAVLATLLERRLVRIQGRKEAPGRPLLYATTRDFLEVFGLPDLGALPPLVDLGDGAEVLMARDLTVRPDGVHATEQGAARGETVATDEAYAAADVTPADIAPAAVDDAEPPVVAEPEAAPPADEDGTRD